MSRNENGKAQPPEKSSNFTRRCSLLSRYLKEKGSFGNIDLGLVRKPDELPGNSNPQGKIKALDVFQRVSKGEPSNSFGSKAKDANLSKASSEPGCSQLTIFFGGQVLVYNEFPADKAKEIMEVAKQSKPVNAEIKVQTQLNVENKQSNMVNLPDLNEPTNSADINQQNQLVERIARRASLHRFFSKRKDRAVARAPYHVNHVIILPSQRLPTVNRLNRETRLNDRRIMLLKPCPTPNQKVVKIFIWRLKKKASVRKISNLGYRPIVKFAQNMLGSGFFRLTFPSSNSF